ncbi:MULTISPECIES: hypothetical protein [Streptomyces]|uniref:Uncharacterized protein n=2 Tax=Streptomyces TaxID=1883 RepID=A0A1E7M1Q9_9ACTN|nr:hypothetical protein [Streptomyces nanshensis]OEV22013.1 hypothetical protein AN221_03505 [Streptomyces nanshensis]
MTDQPLPPAVRGVIAGLVDAVRAGDDARIDRLLERIVRIGTPEALYELRRQLAKGPTSP